MNKNTTIDALLRQLPAAKTGDDFTDRVVSRIAALPSPSRRLHGWGIAAMSAGSVLAIALLWWMGDSFAWWKSIAILLEESVIYRSFAQMGTALTSLFDRTTLSPPVWNGFMAGLFLLLLDAAIYKWKSAKNSDG